MTLKRLLMPLLVVGIMSAMGSMAFAQLVTGPTNITCGLSVPLGATTNATDTGHTEPIAAGGVTAANLSPPTAGGGTVRVSCINTGGVGTTSDPGVVVLTLNLGVPITNNTAGHPSTNAQIRLSTADPDGAGPLTAPTAGDFAVGTNVRIAGLNNAAGQIVIGLGSGGTQWAPTTGILYSAATAGPPVVPVLSQFDIAGVLVSVNGKTGSLAAFLTSTGGISVGSITAPVTASASVNVVSNILRGLKDPTVPTSIPSSVSSSVTGGAAVLNSAGTALKGNFAIRVEENYPDMLRDAAQFNGPLYDGNFPNSPSSDTQVEVRLSNIPNGVTISGCAAVLTDTNNQATSGNPQLNFTNLTNAAPVLTVNFNAALDLANIDVLWIYCTSISASSAALPLPSTPVTATVNLAPTGIALSTGSNNPALTGLTTGQVPRYQLLAQPTAALTVISFPPSNSTLLISFAATLTGYDTGISVANTTSDPFGVTGGGATPSDGTVTFTMYKNDGTSKVYTTTTGSPGAGLTGAGLVKSGSTYSVNLSQLLTAASFGPNFIGYIFVNANFTNAHGSATVYLTSTGAAALSSPVVVLNAVTTASPRPTPESLGQ